MTFLRHAELLLETDLDRPLLLRAEAGDVVAYCAPRPGREGPNEDAVAVLPLPAGGLLLAVADGAGGLPLGAKAAGLAIRNLLDALREESDDHPLRERVLDGFERANRAVLGLGVGAATTLAVVTLEGGQTRSYHVGDSAVLVTGQRGKRKLWTVAHSPVGYAVEAGVLDSREALLHEDLHLVSNLVGMAAMKVEMGPRVSLAARDTVLVASDGLLDNLHLEEIAEIIRTGPLEQAAVRLVQDCRRRMDSPEEGVPSKPDDLGFVLFRGRR